MVIGVGTDILRVARIEKLYQKFPVRFPERLLTEYERQLMSQRGQPVRFLAKRFASKEAVLKALGTGLAGGIRFHDIEIRTAPGGQPQVTLAGQAAEQMRQLASSAVPEQMASNSCGVHTEPHCHLSISDEADYVVAFAVISV